MTEKNSADENAVSSEAAMPTKGRTARNRKPKKSRKSTQSKVGTKSRGRPVWQPSIDDRKTVEQMKFVGESDAMIARSLKVDVDTLRKHCAYELENGYANRRRQVTNLMFEAAEKGNASAIKRLDEMGRVTGAAQALKDRAANQPAPTEVEPPKPEKLGKKAERKVVAERIAASGKFSPPEPPKLVVVNQ